MFSPRMLSTILLFVIGSHAALLPAQAANGAGNLHPITVLRTRDDAINFETRDVHADPETTNDISDIQARHPESPYSEALIKAANEDRVEDYGNLVIREARYYGYHEQAEVLEATKTQEGTRRMRALLRKRDLTKRQGYQRGPYHDPCIVYPNRPGQSPRFHGILPIEAVLCFNKYNNGPITPLEHVASLAIQHYAQTHPPRRAFLAGVAMMMRMGKQQQSNQLDAPSGGESHKSAHPLSKSDQITRSTMPETGLAPRTLPDPGVADFLGIHWHVHFPWFEVKKIAAIIQVALTVIVAKTVCLEGPADLLPRWYGIIVGVLLCGALTGEIGTAIVDMIGAIKHDG